MPKTSILISTELMRDALQFPDSVRLLGTPGRGGNIEIEVESDMIPEDCPGATAVWMKEGDEVKFLRFEPCNLPIYPVDIDGQEG